MIIILEGPDNAGKSTLAQKLSKDLKLEVVHPGGTKKNILDIITQCQNQAQVFGFSTELDFIFDRATCISNLIYRNEPEYDRVYGIYQGQLKTAKNVVIIYCRPSDERLRNFDDHVTKDHEDESIVQHAKDNVDRIIDEYDNLMAAFARDKHYNTLKYNFELDTGGDGYRDLLALLMKRRDVK